jgi:hypothetical protein
MTAPIVLGTPPTPVVITELEYASDLLRRAERSISREFDVLRGAGVKIDGLASSALCFTLMSMAVQCHMLALDARSARAAMAMDTSQQVHA